MLLQQGRVHFGNVGSVGLQSFYSLIGLNDLINWCVWRWQLSGKLAYVSSLASGVPLHSIYFVDEAVDLGFVDIVTAELLVLEDECLGLWRRCASPSSQPL